MSEKKITNTEQDPQPSWLLGGHPQGIETQEALGQRELIVSEQLPIKVNFPYGANAKELYESMGIEVVGPTERDDQFYDVKLPAGWKKVGTGHAMWTDLVDDKGVKRASIFYKAAFYDREAFINFEKV